MACFGLEILESRAAYHEARSIGTILLLHMRSLLLALYVSPLVLKSLRRDLLANSNMPLFGIHIFQKGVMKCS
uniref:Uncharacterized protein n=1 Tax=Anguilla anguilla TaxID=7936 RepID=A0A0E9WAA8_ANGAN